MTQCTVIGAGSTMAEHEVATSDLIKHAKLDERFDISPDVIVDRMGIVAVRHADDHVLPGDLATEASKRALIAANLAPHEIDMVLYTGIERNCTEPATAHFVANDLGIDPKRLQYCFDVSNACHGFTAGMLIARKFLTHQDDDVEIRNVLVCTGERSSGKTKVICDDFRDGSLGKADIENTLGAFTVGDAGGAMILTQCDDGKGIQAVTNIVNSRFADLCFYQDYGLDRGVKPRYAMKMPQICARTKRIIQKHAPEAFSKLHWNAADIHHGLFHQVGKRVHQDWLDITKIDQERAPTTYQRLGNLASANLPVIWAQMTERGDFKAGDNVFIISAGSGISVSMLGLSL